ncbi:YrvL family regulatory protein [Gracilibacillus kekensis]|uniref:Regulatory protein YrvL n=1 Tax=Gracilibacillus kekensis TaxID=1027249 RepID=A0A1M7P1Y1_9BACI|nr:YrvL family regulatory protein [Gracilibacillus kekensis]SHN10439.1 Regulatory protein YrvL [Gracilibacillus kekensis]
MSKYKDDSSRDLKEKVATVAGITSLAIMVLVFVLGLYFFGMAGLFDLLGVQYKSIWSIVIFVISYFLLGMISDLFFKVIFKLSIRNITGKFKILAMKFSLVAISNWLVLFTVDEFMESIILSIRTEIIITLVIVLLEIVFDDKKDSIAKTD